ncbi:hypothetical protein [Serratia marcescens]|uniref:hypothetical protein n=1 Tax=Serratia marcescens TaxID=615 RepID=UPI0021CC6FF1|nr:hypothetical protein [Serratia marcescens]
MADMLRDPQGYSPYATRLLNAMIGAGAGCAAGNKNLCIGVGGTAGWENLNPARDPRRRPQGGFYARATAKCCVFLLAFPRLNRPARFFVAYLNPPLRMKSRPAAVIRV